MEKFRQHLPTYPGEVFDYYRIHRVVLVGGATLSARRKQAWENKLSELNAVLGGSNQCNVVIVLVNGLGREYTKALSQHWLGGKKNDIIVVLGVNPDPDMPEIRWVEVLCWSKTSDLAIQLRDSLENLGQAFMPEVFKRVQSNVMKFYRRKPMEDFRYLYANVKPSTFQWWVTILLNVLISVVAGVFFLNNEEREWRR